jgi:hypothetical protein
MAEPYRLKLKIGQYEFEAEGDPQVVHEQFQAFKELIAMQPAQPQVVPIPPPEPYTYITMPPTLPAPSQPDAPVTGLDFDRISRRDDRVVSLTIRPSTTADAILLILLGQKLLRGNDAVTGGEVISGLEATGGISIQRPDRVLEKLARDGDVIAFGEGRGKKYRLTNTGLNKARQMAATYIATVA